MSNVYNTLLEAVKSSPKIDLNFDLSYKVVFSALHGNFPVNSAIQGSILDFPVDLRLEYHIYTNTKGNFPVNSCLRGTIGGEAFFAKMNYKAMYNTIIGNMPVNTGITVKWNDARQFLRMPTRWAIAPARGSGMGGGGKKKFGMHTIRKVRGGQIIEVDNVGDGDGGPSQNSGRPLPAGLHGRIGDLLLDIDFSYTYFTNTITGRNPINNKATGTIRLAA